MTGAIESTAEEIGSEVAVVEHEPATTLFRTDDPLEVVEKAGRVADALKGVLVRQGLTARIQGRDHVLVEGWTTLGSMLGVFPVLAWTRKVPDGWEARVEARTLDGRVIGAAESECLRTEKEWGPKPSRGKPREDFALRSMAQTRATSKALRAPLGFIVTLAGYAATPAEEMPDDGPAAPAPNAPTVEQMTDLAHQVKDHRPTTEVLGEMLKQVGANVPVAHLEDGSWAHEISREQAGGLLALFRAGSGESDIPVDEVA